MPTRISASMMSYTSALNSAAVGGARGGVRGGAALGGADRGQVQGDVAVFLLPPPRLHHTQTPRLSSSWSTPRPVASRPHHRRHHRRRPYRASLSPMASATAGGAPSSSQPVCPFLPSDAGSAAAPCIYLIGSRPSGEVTVQLKDQHTSGGECYKLDAFFGQEDRVCDIFDQEVSAVIPGIFEGINATVFAYGATGSGKTYTMQGTEDLPGLIPLAVKTIPALCTGTWCSVKISYYEVYMERYYDLFEPKAKEIMALDDKDGNLQLKGLAWVK